MCTMAPWASTHANATPTAYTENIARVDLANVDCFLLAARTMLEINRDSPYDKSLSHWSPEAKQCIDA
jgi:hypothetical protein